MKTVLLGDILKPISETFRFNEKPVVFLNTSDIEAGKFLNQERITPISLPGQAKKRIEKNDILFSEIRPANKRYAFVDFDAPDYVVSTKLMVLRSQKSVYPRFAYYWITAPQQLETIQAIAESRSGTFPQITFDSIKNLKVNLPDYRGQQEISNFIDCIDENIELNRRMNETLEKIGQALFKHYFIDNPEAKTWPKGKLNEVTDVITGKGSAKSILAEGGKYPLYGAGGIMGTSDEFLFDEPLIITGRVGTLGRVQAVSGKAWFSDNVLILKPKSERFGFVYYFAKSIDFTSMNRGSSQPLVTQTDLKNRTIVLPDSKTLQEFELQFQPLFTLTQKNEKENQTLAKLRDSLLPRLISGKIKV